MFTILVFVAGVVVGWNFPQPAYAKTIQAKVLGWFKK